MKNSDEGAQADMAEIDELYESICELSDLTGEEWDEAIASIGDTIAMARGALYDRLMPKGGYEWPRYKAGNRIKVRDRVRIQSDGQMPHEDGCEGVVEGITFFCCEDDDSGWIGVEIVVCKDGDDRWTRVAPEHLEEI